jgi:uncharacterized protein YpmS
MPRKLRLFLLFGGGIIGLLAAALAGLYWASRYEPAFYRKALTADSASREKGSKEMLCQILAFESNLKREGQWQATFTAEQINGWLAFDLPRNHPQVLSAEFHEPCVTIEPNQIQLACRYEKGLASSVLCLAVEPYVPEPNVLALRIVSARAGLLPLPLNNVLDGISNAARNAEFRLQWRQADGNPVAIITFPSPDEKGELTIRIKTVRLGEGKIFIAGSTKRNE